MRVTVGDQEIQVYFEYGNAVFGKKLRPAVTCGIRTVPAEGPLQDGELIGVGVAVCSPADQYNKVVGRRIAFQKALEDAGYSREQKRTIWDAYLATHRIAPGRPVAAASGAAPKEH